ncbi:histidine phosphatase family protein [Rhabdothermincola salaria]|uniref:histidine phosphatase family protein n=1 Tax=Rhabdothermincola salaria TaxID=2903142 RepID=UPI001E48D34D|nr:histidine phosphatase family protein [Rhabdothermincola salaria]MCD9623092.1 histidine phosphatase family protein [Rhabdothermincola salaria]
MSTPDGETPEFDQRPFSAPAGATEVLLVRHGQSAPFRPGAPFALVDGQGDPPLSDFGRWQADRIAERLAGESVDAVYVTTLRRTVETIAPLVDRVGVEARVEPDLREVHLGEWEGGLFRQKVAEGHPALARMDRDQDWGAIPGAEPVAALRARVRGAIERIHAAHPDQRVVAVSHGGAIGAVLAEASGSRSLAFSGADNASISHLVILGDRWIVRRFNDTGHLAGELSTRPDQLT